MWLKYLFTNVYSGKSNVDNTRKMSFSGTFYPSSKGDNDRLLSNYFKPYKKTKYYDNVRAIIIPHGLYRHSGKISASAIGRINPLKKYDHIFIIGSSRTLYVDGASVENKYNYYDTPYGKIEVDKELCNKLIAENSCFSHRPGVHNNEHCIEVQLPILKYYFKKLPPIVPIIIGSESIHLIMDIAFALKSYFDGNNLFVISSDFSQFPSYENANKIDAITAKSIVQCSLDDFFDVAYAESKLHIPNLVTLSSGKSAIAILLHIASQCNDVKVSHTGYINTGDVNKEKRDRVVGYHGFVFTRDTIHEEQPDLYLSDNEKNTLLAVARNSIEKRLLIQRAIPLEEWKLTENLKRKCGIYISLTKNGVLRGSIGHFDYDVSLFQNVVDMSQASAFDDPRFHPLIENEVNKINIEISVITHMRRIYELSQFIVGKHGICIKKDGKCGLFLPQVANEVKWNKEEFISHCARDKAGIGWNGWKNAEIYLFETIVFSELSQNCIK